MYRPSGASTSVCSSTTYDVVAEPLLTSTRNVQLTGSRRLASFAVCNQYAPSAPDCESWICSVEVMLAEKLASCHLHVLAAIAVGRLMRLIGK